MKIIKFKDLYFDAEKFVACSYDLKISGAFKKIQEHFLIIYFNNNFKWVLRYETKNRVFDAMDKLINLI